MLCDQFEMAAGTVIGRDHELGGKHNQDSWYCLTAQECGRDVMIAVVCDGCGSCEASHIGAHIGARLTAHAFNASARDGFLYLKNARSKILDGVRTVAGVMEPLRGLQHQCYYDHFLFTIVAAVITESTTWLVSCGDGVAAMNGEVARLGPYPNNEPPYIAYGDTALAIVRELPTPEVWSLLIGSDGLDYFIARQDSEIPGRNERVGPLCQFWEDDRYFMNRDMVRRKIAVVGQVARMLPDDTTLVAIRRKEEVIGNGSVSQWQADQPQAEPGGGEGG